MDNITLSKKMAALCIEAEKLGMITAKERQAEAARLKIITAKEKKGGSTIRKRNVLSKLIGKETDIIIIIYNNIAFKGRVVSICKRAQEAEFVNLVPTNGGMLIEVIQIESIRAIYVIDQSYEY